ncbi:MAG TPA: cell division protein ZapA [Thermodesulfobacteriaceae bacterium]|nr:cell division protein ZapA [Thermodesulfobacteriaceae bacterium]
MSRIRIDIFGQSYDLKTDDSEVDTEEIENYVQAKIKHYEKAYQSLPPHKVMLLLVLDMARDYILTRRQLRELEKLLATSVDRLAGKIDSIME